MATAKKKSDAEKLAEYEVKIQALKAKMANNGLDIKSPGVNKLMSAVDDVIKSNKCKVIDVLKTISRLKKQAVEITPKERKARKKKPPTAKKRTPAKAKATTADKAESAKTSSQAPARKKERATVVANK
jgi:hypothetical protein